MRRLPSRNTVAIVVVVLLVMVAIAAFLTRGLGGTSAGAGKSAPSFSGVTLAGQTVSLAQFQGKPLLLVYMTYT